MARNGAHWRRIATANIRATVTSGARVAAGCRARVIGCAPFGPTRPGLLDHVHNPHRLDPSEDRPSRAALPRAGGPAGRRRSQRESATPPRSTPRAPAGALLTDVDGNVLIDFAGGIGTLNVGHANPEVVRGGRRPARAVHAHLLQRRALRGVRRARREAQRDRARDAGRRRRCSPTAAPRRSRTPSRSPATRPAARPSSSSSTPSTAARS